MRKDTASIITCPPKKTALSHPLVYINLRHEKSCPYCGKKYDNKR